MPRSRAPASARSMSRLALPRAFCSWMSVMDQALPPFQVFLEDHLDPVRAFLRGMVGPHDADDCLQDTFISALRAYPRAHAGNLRAWVFTIARRKAIDHQRARSRGAVPVADVQPLVDRVNHAEPSDVAAS